MAQADATSTPSASTLDLGGLVAAGTRQMEAVLKQQAELLHVLQEINSDWADRMKTEAEAASQYLGKLAAVRSFADAVTVSQEWAGQWMQMAAEDGRRILSDTQKIIGASTRLPGNGPAAGT